MKKYMFRFATVVVKFTPAALIMLAKTNIYMKHPEKYDRDKRYRLSQWICNTLRRLSLTKTQVFGVENLPKDTGYILCPNHQGKYDALGIVISHEEPISILMEEKQSRKLVANQVIDLTDGKRLPFDDPKKQIQILKEIGEEVKNGRKYLIFPEGGYEYNRNTLQKFNAGCFRCSFDSKTPIVPVVLLDSWKAMNSNSLMPCVTQIHYLKPIEYDEYKDLNKTKLSDLVKERIQEKLDELLKERGA